VLAGLVPAIRPNSEGARARFVPSRARRGAAPARASSESKEGKGVQGLASAHGLGTPPRGRTYPVEGQNRLRGSVGPNDNTPRGTSPRGDQTRAVTKRDACDVRSRGHTQARCCTEWSKGTEVAKPAALLNHPRARDHTTKRGKARFSGEGANRLNRERTGGSQLGVVSRVGSSPHLNTRRGWGSSAASGAVLTCHVEPRCEGRKNIQGSSTTCGH
jgi:hypothetical protein